MTDSGRSQWAMLTEVYLLIAAKRVRYRLIPWIY